MGNYAVIADLPFAIEDRSPNKRPVLLGELGKSRDGSPQDSRRDEREGWELRLSCSTFAEAAEARDILEGRAHVWHFNGTLEAFSALGPDPVFEALLKPVDGFFEGALRVSIDESIFYDAQLSGDWTLIARIREDDATSPWEHVAVTSDGDEWLDGVKQGAPIGVTNVVNVNANRIELKGEDRTGTPSNMLFDELVAFPFVVLDATLDIWTALAEPFSPFPDLNIRGDAVAEPIGITARATTRDAPYIQAGGLTTGAGWTNNGALLNFRLVENEPRRVGMESAQPFLDWDFDAIHTDPAAPEVRELIRGQHGTLIGSATSGAAAGRDGIREALLVPSGANNGCEVAHDASQNITGDLTICGWVRPDAISGTQNLVVKDDGVSGTIPYRVSINSLGGFQFRHQASVVSFETFNSAPSLATAGVWVWFAIVRKTGTSVEFFVNGGRDILKTQASAITPVGVTAALRFAGDVGGGGAPFAGRLDELAIFNQALSARGVFGAFLATKRGGRYRVTG